MTADRGKIHVCVMAPASFSHQLIPCLQGLQVREQPFELKRGHQHTERVEHQGSVKGGNEKKPTDWVSLWAAQQGSTITPSHKITSIGVMTKGRGVAHSQLSFLLEVPLAWSSSLPGPLRMFVCSTAASHHTQYSCALPRFVLTHWYL